MIQLYSKHVYHNDFSHVGVTHNHSAPLNIELTQCANRMCVSPLAALVAALYLLQLFSFP